MRGVEIVEVDLRTLVCDRRLADHARAAILCQLVEQQAGEREMAQMVDGELLFRPADRMAQRRDHDAGIVDQQVDLRLFLRQIGRLADRSHVRQVEREKIEIGLFRPAGDLLDRGSRLVGIAAGEDHASTLARKTASDLQPDAGIGAGDDGGLAALVGYIGIGKAHANISICDTGAKLRRCSGVGPYVRNASRCSAVP